MEHDPLTACSQESFLAIVTESGEPFDYDVLSEVPKPQHFLTQCIHTSSKNSLMSTSLNDREKARLHSVSINYSGAFLNVVPIKSLGLAIESKVFSAALRLRLGLTQYQKSSICPVCFCHSDEMGDHSIACASAERIERHNDIVRVSAAVVRDVGARVDLEPSRLFPDDKKRPDFTIASWNGEFTAFDVSVVSPFTSSNPGKAAGNIGAHLNFAAIKMEEKYSEELSVLGAGFIPLIFDALGGFP
ncbi:hypothetical protein O9G_003825 [Rozella allomycis CSF55]|uniref:Uncharacterized protein n=1 Tax=Rozella allomycis (strain CSF55) TaxID=988480 RepID=A0A075AZ54_ROZAC|nr:hypothetical protein O9G_003825 [Rozella allomycis CSF55]|eukprot:EPZ35414.1 hypothetical protein O9G_003825 [Rozella allomycis CSF55]